MIRDYDHVGGVFTVGKKKYKKYSKTILKDICLYVIGLVRDGGTLNTLPNDSDVLPPLYEILAHIDSDKELKSALVKAEKSRLGILKEELISLSREYSKSHDPELKNSILAAEKIYSSLKKDVDAGQEVTINFSSVFPENFWEAPTEYEIDEDGNKTGDDTDRNL